MSFKDKLPAFPTNRLNLQQGSLIVAADQLITDQLGVPVGQEIPIGWDGQYVRCAGFTWGVDQLCGEIEKGWWTISDQTVDFDDPRQAAFFRSYCVDPEPN
jgi:hypothetical protein